MYQLDSIAYRYYDFAVQLGMQLEELKLLEDQYHHQGGKRILIEIVDWWLRKFVGDEKKVWGVISKCLERMNETRLSKTIRDTHTST